MRKGAGSLPFLDQTNLARLDLERIAWRARKSADFFHKLIAVLEKRHVFSEPIYRYAVVHNTRAAGPGCLADDFARNAVIIDSEAAKIDPIERRVYEHLEYSPLVNQRAVSRRQGGIIPGAVTRGTVQHLLDILAHKPTLDAADQMSVVYYLFLPAALEKRSPAFIASPRKPCPPACSTITSAATPPSTKSSPPSPADSPNSTPTIRWIAGGSSSPKWRRNSMKSRAKSRSVPDDKEPNREKQQGELATCRTSLRLQSRKPPGRT